MTKRFLSAAEAADELCVSRPTIYMLCRTGALAYTRIGGSIKLSQEDIEAYVAQQRRGGPPTKPATTAEHSPGQNSPGDGGEGEATVPFPPSAPQ